MKSENVSIQPPATVAVTGANGFIGAHAVYCLLKEGYSVRAVVRDPNNKLKYGFLEDLATELNASARLKLYPGDLFKSDSYDEAFIGADAVIHTAAVVELFDKTDAANKVVKPSVEGTQNVLRSINKAKSVRRYIHTSSAITIQSFDKPEDHIFTEHDWNTWSTIENGDAYGYAKTTAEKLVWEKDVLCNADLVVLNPMVVIGPVLTKVHTKSTAVFLRQILHNGSMLNFSCSFVDVRDVAQGFIKALQTPKAGGERFLLVKSKPMYTIDLVPIAQKALPEYKLHAYPKPPLFIISLLAYFPSLGRSIMSDFEYYGLTKQIKFDNSKSKEILGITYRPLEETVKDTIVSMTKYIKPKLK